VRKDVIGRSFANDSKERIYVMSVVLINPFEVPQGQEEAFLKWWHEAARVLRQAPGFLSTRLHESLDPQTTFRFVNVAEWESPQHFQAAMSSEAFQQMRGKMPFTAHPALYRLIV
jgi:heme-degrading monooxygenase HmoA